MKNIYSIREAAWNLLLPQKNIYSMREASWKTYSIREAAWNLLLYQHILRYELIGATLGRKKLRRFDFPDKIKVLKQIEKNRVKFKFSTNLNLCEESSWCDIFSLFCLRPNSLMNCLFRCEVKWNGFLLEIRLILISNYLTTFTQNLAILPLTLIRITQTSLRRIRESLICMIQKQKNTREHKTNKNNVMDLTYPLPNYTMMELN